MLVAVTCSSMTAHGAQLVGDAAKLRYKALGIDLDTVKSQLLEVNNLALEGKPEDLVITSHICRGNYNSTYFSSGAYDSVADYVFARENVNALLLEYDDERSEALRHLQRFLLTRRWFSVLSLRSRLS